MKPVFRISKFRRYLIYVTGLDPLSLRELGRVQCFGEFSASGRSRTIKLVGMSGICTN